MKTHKSMQIPNLNGEFRYTLEVTVDNDFIEIKLLQVGVLTVIYILIVSDRLAELIKDWI